MSTPQSNELVRAREFQVPDETLSHEKPAIPAMGIVQRNASEPAFAMPAGEGHDPRFGLTKRELFAAMAMQGYLANGHNLDDPSMTRVAALSVKRADALLAALLVSPKP